MNKFLSHRTAAEYYGIFGIREALPGAPNGATPNGDVREITFCGHAKRFHAKQTRIHSSVLALPSGAVVRHDGVAIASPEMLFLQFASELDIHRLILLGLQLCGHPPGKPEKALTTKQKIVDFLAKANRHRGIRKARRAARYLENGSASVMESLVYMTLALPNALGGYGLDGVVFNHRIALHGKAADLLSQTHCFVDLYYPKCRVAVEYQSVAYHATAAAQGKDAMRAGVLERLGVQVLFFNTIQLYNNTACRDFASVLAARLRRRIQIRAKRFGRMHARLRAIYPRRERL